VGASSIRTGRLRHAVTGIRSTRSFARSPKIKGNARSPSSSPAQAPTARTACASSKPKVAACWCRIRNRPPSRACRGARSPRASSTWCCCRTRCQRLCSALPATPTYGSRPRRPPRKRLTINSIRCCRWSARRRGEISAATRSGRCCAESTDAWACTRSKDSPPTSSACATTRTRSRRSLRI
jgi:hypothetical protein